MNIAIRRGVARGCEELPAGREEHESDESKGSNIVPDFHTLWFPGAAWEPTATRLCLAWPRADGRRSLQEVRSQAEPGNEGWLSSCLSFVAIMRNVALFFARTGFQRGRVRRRHHF